MHCAALISGFLRDHWLLASAVVTAHPVTPWSKGSEFRKKYYWKCLNFHFYIIFIRTKAGSNHCVFTQETCSDANLWPSYGEDTGKNTRERIFRFWYVLTSVSAFMTSSKQFSELSSVLWSVLCWSDFT